MPVIVDAYNVLHTVGVLPPDLAGLGVREFHALLDSVSRYRRRTLTLVCDGVRPRTPGATGLPGATHRPRPGPRHAHLDPTRDRDQDAEERTVWETGEAGRRRRGRRRPPPVIPESPPEMPHVDRPGPDDPRGAVRVVYAGHDLTADDVIDRMVRRSTAPRRLLVVSSDQAVCRRARLRRARTMDSARFLHELEEDVNRTRQENGPVPLSYEVPLDPRMVALWLEYFGLHAADLVLDWPEASTYWPS